MKCPECGHVVQHVDRTCLRCGAELLEAFERQAWRGVEPKPRRPARRRPPTYAAGAWLGLGAALLLAAWGIAALGRASSPRPGTFRDAAGGLAFAAPPGWSLRTDLPAGWRFRRVAELSGPGGSIVVESAAAGVLVARHLEALVREEFNGRRPRLETPAAFLVDGAEARRLAFRAEAGPGQPPVSGEAVAFQGLGRSYLIRFYSDEERLSRAKPGWNAFLASLRVRRSGR